MREVPADFILIEMLQASVIGIVKQYHYQHDFSFGHCWFSVVFSLGCRLIWQRIFFDLIIEIFAEIICKTENFSNFIVGEHSVGLLWFVFCIT